MSLQSLPSRTVHWRTWRKVELSASGARLDHQLVLSSSRSGLWLQVIPLQARHKVAPAVFPRPKGLSGTTHIRRCFVVTRRCQDCLVVVDTFCSNWLRTCHASSAAFSRRRTAVDHPIRAGLYEAGFSTTLEPFVDPAMTCPSASALLEGKELRRGKAAHMKFRQEY